MPARCVCSLNPNYLINNCDWLPQPASNLQASDLPTHILLPLPNLLQLLQLPTRPLHPLQPGIINLCQPQKRKRGTSILIKDPSKLSVHLNEPHPPPCVRNNTWIWVPLPSEYHIPLSQRNPTYWPEVFQV